MKKLITIAALLAAALLAGCASAPQPAVTQPTIQELAAVPPTNRINVFATLARVGTCEMDVAADYTALIASRHRAASALRKKTITVDKAIQVQTLADAARADLDAACQDVTAKLDVERRDQARASIKQIATILGN